MSDWVNDPAEDFSFFDRRNLIDENRKLNGLIYYPHPETKPEHFQSQTVELQTLKALEPCYIYKHTVQLIAMDQPVYRPPSVWITQVLLLLSLINLAIALLISLSQCISAEQLFNCISRVTIYEFLTEFLMVVLTCLAIWGLQKRQHYGKWLAVSILIAAMIVGIVNTPIPRSLEVIYLSIIPSRSPLPDPLEACNHPFGNLTYFCGYESYQELVWKIISDLLPPLILGFLAFRLLYSHAAKRFFHK